MVELIILLGFGFFIWVFISVFSPNTLKKRCHYCGGKHRGNNQYWNEVIGKDLIFTSKQCYNSWMRENYICEMCGNYGKYDETTIQHKFQRKYFYFCTKECKKEFLDGYPNLSYDGYKRHSIPSDLRRIIYKRDEGKGRRCGSKENIHFDHIVPVTKGGSTSEENLELLCQDCNLSKSDKIE